MADQIIVRGYFTATEPGFVKPSGGGSLSFLRADGVWTTPPAVGAPLTDGDKGDITVSSSGAVWTIDPGLALAKLQAIPAGNIVGAVSAGPPVALSGAGATALLNTFTAGAKGLVPASGGSGKDYLRADGTWGGISGASFAPGYMPLTDLQPIADQRLLGNVSGSTAPVAEITAAQIRAMLGIPEVTWQIIAKTNDTVFTSATLADVPRGASGSPTMGWSLVALHSYHFKFMVLVNGDSITTGIGLAISKPASTAFGAYGMMIGAAAAGPTALDVGAITGADDPVIASGFEAVGPDYIFLVEGVIIPTESGSLTLRARTEIGATAVTVRNGSFGILMDRTL